MHSDFNFSLNVHILYVETLETKELENRNKGNIFQINSHRTVLHFVSQILYRRASMKFPKPIYFKENLFS